MLKIQRAAAVAARIRCELTGPCEIVGVDIVETGLRIEGLPAPFSTAIEAGKDHRRLVEPERHELPLAPERFELLPRPFVRFGSSSGEEILRQELSCERRRS